MRRTRGRTVEIDSLPELDRRLAAGARSLTGWRIHSLDLSGRGTALLGCDLRGAAFLGCTFAAGEERVVDAAGALVLPELPGVPVDTYRAALYTADELYDAPAWTESLDGRAYGWSQRAVGDSPDPDADLARTLHDHAIDVALGRWRAGRRLVGVMGGHAARRGEATYEQAARLGRLLARTGLTVATGGGPGAMEAANLGARLASYDVDVLEEALEMLARVPSFSPAVDPWVASAREVAERWSETTPSLGIPTWHYGHEPPGFFATALAKYFGNATREAVLLEVCDSGIVYLPGAGGTIQEVFQDACENYYADESSVAPMILVGERFWTAELPAWPLLEALGRGRTMGRHLHLVDSVEDAAAVVAR